MKQFTQGHAARGPVVGLFESLVPQGLKPACILHRLMYGLKPVPFKLTHYPRFA